MDAPEPTQFDFDSMLLFARMTTAYLESFEPALDRAGEREPAALMDEAHEQS